MEIKKTKKCLIVALSGEIDHHSATDIKNETDLKLESTKIKNLIFDFSRVDFMDSSGVGLLLGRYKLITKKGGIMAIVGVTGTINRIMEMSGVYKLMTPYKHLDDAVNAIEKISV